MSGDQLKKEKEKREKLAAGKEHARIAEARRLADSKQRERNRLDLLHTLNDMDVKGLLTTRDITAAIVDGFLPHVRYVG